MPKPRLPENRGLPARWRKKPSGYYYQVPPGLESAWNGKQTFPLGKTLPEAYKTWASRLETLHRIRTTGQLLDRYALEVVPEKAASTQRGNADQIKKLRTVFGETQLDRITPQDIYKYADKRGKKVSARREIALLSHAYTKAVEWGYIAKHPFKGEVRLKGEKPRDRYIEDWEVIECLSLKTNRKRGSVRVIQAYIKVKLLTGLRAGDLLRLKVSDCRDDGIHVLTKKTGKGVIYEWSESLRSAVDEALKARPVHIAPTLFCNNEGRSYMDEKSGRAYGWESMWKRFMIRVMSETKVTEHFTERDLRAKCATDAQSLEHACALLAHADSKTTRKIYRRKPERVRPLR